MFWWYDDIKVRLRNHSVNTKCLRVLLEETNKRRVKIHQCRAARTEDEAVLVLVLRIIVDFAC